MSSWSVFLEREGAGCADGGFCQGVCSLVVLRWWPRWLCVEEERSCGVDGRWLWWIWTSSVACQEASDAVHDCAGRNSSSLAFRRRRGSRPCRSHSNGRGSRTSSTRMRYRCSTPLSTKEISHRSSQTGSKSSSSRWVHRCVQATTRNPLL